MSEGTEQLSSDDLAIDHQLAQLAGSVRFLLEITPVDADDVREAFLAGDGGGDPVFTYRELDDDPAVSEAALERVDVDEVGDATLRELLRAKRREMQLQVEMLRARGTAEFRSLSVDLHGEVEEGLRLAAEDLLDRLVIPSSSDARLDAEDFLELALAEIEAYREIDPDIDMHAEIRPDVSGVLCQGPTLLIAEDAQIVEHRAQALLQHEIGTHLVTQVNGADQQVSTLGTGLAGYDETQEGLAVLAEIAVGGLTPFRLRQLAARVVTVHRMLDGATFREAHRALVDAGIPEGSAFSTVMRVYRAGGYTKDAGYLRGLVDLLGHVRDGGSLDLFFLGKFSLEDLPHIQDLHDRGLMEPARIMPRYLQDPGAWGRIQEAAATDDLTRLVS